MNSWHVTYLGLKRLPRDLTVFEVEAFFTFSVAERRVIEARRGPELKLGLALQIGFLRMSGRLLDALRIVPAMLWRHLGEQFAAAAPDLASLRAMYRRRRTLFEHQGLACETLGFHWLSEPRRRALVRVLRDELARTTDRQRLLQFARRWLYEHQLIVLRERDLRTMIATAIRSHEAALARGIHDSLDPLLLAQWRATITQPHDSGATLQSWLWAAPAKHSTRQIEEVLERIEVLYRLGVDRHLIDVPDVILRRLRAAARKSATGGWGADRRACTHHRGRVFSALLLARHHRSSAIHGAPARRGVMAFGGPRRRSRAHRLGTHVSGSARRTGNARYGSRPLKRCLA